MVIDSNIERWLVVVITYAPHTKSPGKSFTCSRQIGREVSKKTRLDTIILRIAAVGIPPRFLGSAWLGPLRTFVGSISDVLVRSLSEA